MTVGGAEKQTVKWLRQLHLYNNSQFHNFCNNVMFYHANPCYHYQERSDSVKVIIVHIQAVSVSRGNFALIRKQTRTRLDIMGFTRLMVVVSPLPIPIQMICLYHFMTSIHVNSLSLQYVNHTVWWLLQLHETLDKILIGSDGNLVTLTFNSMLCFVILKKLLQVMTPRSRLLHIKNAL